MTVKELIMELLDCYPLDADVMIPYVSFDEWYQDHGTDGFVKAETIAYNGNEVRIA